jgi:hypothetical protein
MIRREQTYQEREHYKERVSLVVVVTKKETSKETSKEGEHNNIPISPESISDAGGHH